MCLLLMTGVMDYKCSGRRNCTVPVSNADLENANPSCNTEFKSYLDAQYRCQSGMWGLQLFPFFQKKTLKPNWIYINIYFINILPTTTVMSLSIHILSKFDNYYEPSEGKVPNVFEVQLKIYFLKVFVFLWLIHLLLLHKTGVDISKLS